MPRKPDRRVRVSSEFTALREQGIALHDRALEGDEDAAEKAVEQLERYLDRFSKDGEARAYLGSAYAMMARDASSVVNKTRYANRGLRHLDSRTGRGSRNFTVRMIRAQGEFRHAEDVRPGRCGARGQIGA